MDKMIAIIVMFMVVSFIMAGILITGAIPEIFQSGESIRKTQQIVNQTQIQLHHDQTLKNQTQFQLSEITRGMYNLFYAVTDFVKVQHNTTQEILLRQNEAIDAQDQVLEGQNKVLESQNRTLEAVEKKVNTNNILVNDTNQKIKKILEMLENSSNYL